MPYLGAYQLGINLMGLIKSFIDNVFRDRVTPVIGSVLYCDLTGRLTSHSGIYIGNNHIIHLNGKGIVERVTPDEFIDGTTAMSIYVSCNDTTPVGSVKAASRAKQMLGKTRDYNMLFDNCHQFVAGCLTGDFEYNASNFLWILEMKTEDYTGSNTWRVWDR